VLLTAGERHDIGSDLAVAFADERGSIGMPPPGPPADPFTAGGKGFATDPSAPPSDPLTGSYPDRYADSGRTRAVHADPFSGSANGDRKSYVDPNNPFA
jgi:hypothetical protein